MSAKKLTEATHPKYSGPFFNSHIDHLQAQLYKTAKFRKHPVELKTLKHFAEELGLLLGPVEVDEEFTTSDGTQWNAIRIPRYLSSIFKIAFPKEEDPHHRDGMVSSHHIALYYFSERDFSEQELDDISKMIVRYLLTGHPSGSH